MTIKDLLQLVESDFFRQWESGTQGKFGREFSDHSDDYEFEM